MFHYARFIQIATEESENRTLLTANSTSKKITNTYLNGGLKSISDFGTNEVLNNLEKTYAYNSMGFLTEIKTVNGQTSTPVKLMRLEFDFDPQKGLLNSRHNSLFNWDETFSYDSLDRLTDFNDNNGDNSQSYDSRGRITQNSLIGSYGYSGNSYQQISLDLNTAGQDYYQDISFNAFKKPVQITEPGKDKIDFGCNAFEGRSNMFYGRTQSDKTQRRYQKHYAASGSMEIKIDKNTGETDFVLYLGGDAYTAPVIWHSKQDGSASTGDDYYYLHRDYLGSILAITDAHGVYKEKRHFDAWGNIVKLEDGNGNALSSFDILDRGYTGHEHLLSVGIINMNGRLYDPLLHRFLSPDNFVQDPFNTQNFNRYGYVLNNPLKYTDPSGEFILIAMGIGAVIGAITQAVKPGANFGTILGGALIGGLAGLVGAGVGSVVAGGSFFGGSVATTIGFGSGFTSGTAGGFAGGFVGGAGNAWLSGASFGDGLMAGLQGGAIGGVAGGLINGISSELRYQKQLGTFSKGLRKMNMNASDPVPMNDRFIKKAQEAWIPDAPTETLINHSVENVPASAVSRMNSEGAAAMTAYTHKGGILTGNSSIYYNPSGAAFTSAKQLYFVMAHEFVHVSQFASLAGQSTEILTRGFVELMEYGSYGLEFSLGSGNAGGFSPQAIRSLSKAYPNYINQMNYMNFPWTRNINFKHPF